MTNTLVGRKCRVDGSDKEYTIVALDYTIEDADYNSKNFCVSGVVCECSEYVQAGMKSERRGRLSHHNLKDITVLWG